jgi:hypothetical protein
LTPAVGWTEHHYWQARHDCERAWISTQPQYVIPGVLDELDAGAVRLVEPAAATLSPECGGLALTHEGHGANLVRVARRAQKGA